jgi:hypothetical protein
MWKNLISVVLAASLLVTTTFVETSKAKSTAEKVAKKEAEQVEKVKQKIAKLRAGEKAGVEVELKNSQKLKGYVSEIEETSFVVTDRKTQATTRVAYHGVKNLWKTGWSKQATVILIIAGGLAVTAYVVARHIAW